MCGLTFLVYLAIAKGFEPLLLNIPIGMGGILANIPIANIAALPIVEIMNGIPVTISSGGFLGQIYTFGIESGLFPLFIFIGVGAMTDFGPLIANPKTALLGAAAQIGIFGTFIRCYDNIYIHTSNFFHIERCCFNRYYRWC
ncbi:sodium ion-translocating decarboxylase subunit beta [Brachyspira hyodysenteriae]|nr:sodium ion-translocating decarboxylase subunit beta [Brachyspira hyodysenteriae]MCZ9894017.1 sodium ion-translocating decarboxylase subunit beta [Brachyspira hyodysenteriae]